MSANASTGYFLLTRTTSVNRRSYSAAVWKGLTRGPLSKIHGAHTQKPIARNTCAFSSHSQISYYLFFMRCSFFAGIVQIWLGIGRRCSPATPKHFWVVFGKHTCFVTHIETCLKNYETPMGRKTDCCWKTIQIKQMRVATTLTLAVRLAPHLPYGAQSWQNEFWQAVLILFVEITKTDNLFEWIP